MSDKHKPVVTWLNGLATKPGIARTTLDYIEELRERVDQLAAPARRVIEMAGAEEGVYIVALMNAYLKRIEWQAQELHRLRQCVAELEQQIEGQERRVDGPEAMP